MSSPPPPSVTTLAPHLPVPGDGAEVAVRARREVHLDLVAPAVGVERAREDVDVDVVVVAGRPRVERERVAHAERAAGRHAVLEDESRRAGLGRGREGLVVGHAVVRGPGEDLLGGDGGVGGGHDGGRRRRRCGGGRRGRGDGEDRRRGESGDRGGEEPPRAAAAGAAGTGTSFHEGALLRGCLGFCQAGFGLVGRGSGGPCGLPRGPPSCGTTAALGSAGTAGWAVPAGRCYRSATRTSRNSMRSEFPWFCSPMNPLSNWRRSVGGSPARDDWIPGAFSNSLMTTPLRMIV